MTINRLEGRLADESRREWLKPRLVSQLAAVICSGEPDAIMRMIEYSRSHGLSHTEIYELILQSYLFLGFPRMLIAADALDSCWTPDEIPEAQTRPITPEESGEWYERGLKLCQKIYGTAFEPLRKRVERIAPEVFRWMIIEGYGKVLSRDGLDLINRELGIVATLIMENRRDQLYSHLRGALNAGAPIELLETVIEDLGEEAGAGYHSALHLLQQNGLSG